MDTELKPCPFCGSAAHVYDWDMELDEEPPVPSEKQWDVTCLNTKCGVCLAAFDTKEEAIAAWNTRKEPHP